MRRYFIMAIILVLTLSGCGITKKKEESASVTESANRVDTVSQVINGNYNIKLNKLASSPEGAIVGCGENGIIAVTENLEYWSSIQLDEGVNFEDIIYYNDGFVVLGIDTRIQQKVLHQYSLENNRGNRVHTLDWNIKNLKVVNDKLFLIGSQDLIVTTNMNDFERITTGDEKGQKDIYYGTIDYNQEKYIITGGGGFIATSSDLNEWDFFSEPQPGSLTSYGSTVMDKTTVVVGDHLWIATSKNGEDWLTPYAEEDFEEKKIKINNKDQIPDYETLCLFDVTNNGEEFVAVGQRGIVLTSKDGVAWDANQREKNSWITDILWNGVYFVILSEDGVYYSSNAERWEKLPFLFLYFTDTED